MTYTAMILDPRNLHDVWEDVAPDVDECRGHDRDEVWLEDVYSSIRAGNALLMVIRDDTGGYAGMAVLVHQTDPFNPNNRTLHVWYTNTRAKEATAAGLAFAEELARREGCAMVTFRGYKAEFERWGERLGFELGDVEMRKVL